MTKIFPVTFCLICLLACAPAVRAGDYIAVGARKAGVPVGDYEIRDNAGDMIAKGKFTKGKMDGVWVFFDSHHVKIAEVTYAGGVRSGVFKTFCSSLRFPQWAGRQESQGMMAGDLVTGRHISYSPDGDKTGDATFKAGNVTKASIGTDDEAQKAADSDLKFIIILEGVVLDATK